MATRQPRCARNAEIKARGVSRLVRFVTVGRAEWYLAAPAIVQASLQLVDALVSRLETPRAWRQQRLFTMSSAAYVILEVHTGQELETHATAAEAPNFDE